jgi:hypothetical protein
MLLSPAGSHPCVPSAQAGQVAREVGPHLAAVEVRSHGRQSGDFPPEPSATSRRSRLRLLVARRARSCGSVTTVDRAVRFRLMSKRQPAGVVILFVRETHRAAVVTNNRLAGPCGAAGRECSRGEPQGWSQAWERRAVATRRAATTVTAPDHLKRVWARDADDRGGPLGKIAPSSPPRGWRNAACSLPPSPPPLQPFPIPPSSPRGKSDFPRSWTVNRRRTSRSNRTRDPYLSLFPPPPSPSLSVSALPWERRSRPRATGDAGNSDTSPEFRRALRLGSGTRERRKCRAE